MLFQASDISPDVLNGTGCVDASAPVEISWRLGGTTPLAAWKADIYEGTAPVWTSGKVTLQTPVYPLDPTGIPRTFTTILTSDTTVSGGILTPKIFFPPLIRGEGGYLLGGWGDTDFPAGAIQFVPLSLVNGHEYRLFITQWDSADVQTLQTTPSVFLCRAAPVLTLSAPSTLASRTALITASYSQSQGDPIASMRWTATVDGTLIHDSGTITGAAEPTLTLQGLLPETQCTVTLEIQTEAGATATASALINVSYPVSPRRGEVFARCRDGLGCIEVSWTRFAGAASYSVLRREGEAGSLERVGDCSADVGTLRDYGVLSGRSYSYYVFPSSPYAYLTLPMVSDPVKAELTAFRLIEAREDPEGVFTPLNIHLFTCSDGDLMPGGISNNNVPSLRPGLSEYPVLLPSPSNYASGTLSGYIGNIRGEGPSISFANAIQPSSNPLVLLTPKGDRYLVSTSGPITRLINYKSPRMPVLLRIPWVETGPAPVAVTGFISSGFLPVDGVILSCFSVDVTTGMLQETTGLTPRPSPQASSLSITSEGILAVTPATAVTPAALSLGEDCSLIAVCPDDTPA